VSRPSGQEGVNGLSDALQDLLRAYEIHLRAERGLSAHSVRAYLGDVCSLLDHAVRMHRPEIDQVDLLVLRSWLARQASSGGGPPRVNGARSVASSSSSLTPLSCR